MDAGQTAADGRAPGDTGATPADGTGSRGPGHGGPARGYSWEPFAEGNMAALKSGARSPRVVEPLAVQLAERLLGDGNTPDYLRSPQFGPAVMAWARAEVKAQLVHDWLDGLGVEEQLTQPKGGSRSPLEQWRMLETTAAGHRARLGLDPVSRARLARDLGAAQAAAEASLDRLAEQGRAIRERRESAQHVGDQGDGDDSAD